MATIGKYLKETSWALAAKGVAFVFYYGLIYYLTHRMSLAEWGNLSGFLALLNVILLISDQGLNAATRRYVAEARVTGDLGGVFRATFTLRLLTSLVFTAVIALALRPLLHALGQPGYILLMQRSLVLIGLYAVMDYFE